jgi:hypothetical protein
MNIFIFFMKCMPFQFEIGTQWHYRLLLWVEGHAGIPPLVTDAFTVVTTRARYGPA